MESEGAEPAVTFRLRCPAAWLDTESAAVVTILLGIIQIILSACFAYTTQNPPRLFFLTLVLGVLIIAGGSFTMANERYPRKILVQGCACSNVVSLLVALLALCFYCYSITHLKEEVVCADVYHEGYYHSEPPGSMYYQCPGQTMKAYSWCVTLMLIIFDIGAVLMHCFLSVTAIRTLKMA